MGIAIAQRLPKWLLEAPKYEFADLIEGVRLHLNESPREPPEHVIKAACGVLRLCNRYLHLKYYNRLRELLAEYVGVEPKCVLPTPGADSAIRAVYMAFALPGDPIVMPRPCYSMARLYAMARGLKIQDVELRESGDWWRLDPDVLVEKSRNAVLVVIDDPNNPTGSPMLRADESIISALCEVTRGFVIIDEAYYEFAGYTAAGLTGKYDNLIVIRTLSKAFCLAGFRLGYIIANENVVKALERLIIPFDISLPSLAAGVAALEDRSYVENVVREVRENRDYVIKGLRELGIRAYNSMANFVLFRHDGDLLEPLMSRGIVIRRPMDGFYRVSIGSKGECRLFLDVVRKIVGEGRCAR